MWDQRYSEPGFAYGTEPNDFLVESVERLKPNSRILCLAEGEGRNAVYLARLGHRVTAVDSSSVGLEKASSLANEHGVAITVIHVDLNDFVIEPDSFDCIVSIFCQLPTALRRKVHKDTCSGLAPGGTLILEGFTKKQIDYDTGGPKNLDMLFDLDELKEEFGSLELLHCIETEREVLEGGFHTGVCGVVQIIAAQPDSNALKR